MPHFYGGKIQWEKAGKGDAFKQFVPPGKIYNYCYRIRDGNIRFSEKGLKGYQL